MSSTTTPRTIADVDEALRAQREDRRLLRQRIDNRTRELATMREDHARAARRIDVLLDEREALTHACPDTPAGLTTEDAS
jgi:hypothetical protein